MGQLPQDYMAQITASFVESALERLDELDGLIDNFYKEKGDRGQDFLKFQHDIHSLKGSAGTFGFQLVSVIAHRLEDYLESSRRLTKDEFLEVQKFLDAMRAILADGKDPGEDKYDAILGALPTTAASASAQPAEVRAIEAKVLLVVDSGVIRRALGQALGDRGADVVFVDNALAAVDLSLTLKPDFVVSAQELKPFSGNELAGVMRALRGTQHVRFALLTTNDDLISGRERALGEVIRKDKDAASNVIAWLERCLFDD